ncbi:FKBP-type peptidyl-prolyl cis-trans isomerase [Sabulilitoribacter arenilitoris]|uniref:Peptidyl-prolyl cis-trans isomerase n=1 Tax=Wocania arenilitoris TaxID=2044858 RepID=A0AAE3EQ46_9FLAO|nr:FKBP-type peptidyl-prolyl cis-trans isomerase [Wocania arenilitoris]MCF7568863.1 FKBP-type peptidyl-prolyl cis-trans isomerase [Wocania arenilitoris]
MKTIKFLSVVVCASAVLLSCNKNGVTNKPLNTQIDSVNYAIGAFSAKGLMANIKGSNFDEADKDLIKQAFINVLDSTDVLIEDTEAQKILSNYFAKKQQEDQKKAQAEQLKKLEEQYNDVKVAGENFLEENKTKEGVKTTESGLQYIVLKEGNGEKPEASSKVKVHYHGTTTGGEVFDSSVDRGTPSEFGLNQVIKGWTEGIQLMPVGSKYKFFIPQELAYGAFPRQGGVIKPFDVLVFEVELLEIVK